MRRPRGKVGKPWGTEKTSGGRGWGMLRRGRVGKVSGGSGGLGGKGAGFARPKGGGCNTVGNELGFGDPECGGHQMEERFCYQTQDVHGPTN